MSMLRQERMSPLQTICVTLHILNQSRRKRLPQCVMKHMLKLIKQEKETIKQKAQLLRDRYYNIFFSGYNIHSTYLSAFFYVAITFWYDRSIEYPIATIFNWIEQ
jgi:hypothetical protein